MYWYVKMERQIQIPRWWLVLPGHYTSLRLASLQLNLEKTRVQEAGFFANQKLKAMIVMWTFLDGRRDLKRLHWSRFGVRGTVGA
jgi:hypothetical protein